jgi:peptidoglycan/LPS O-acetylase OafA/YrhL
MLGLILFFIVTKKFQEESANRLGGPLLMLAAIMLCYVTFDSHILPRALLVSVALSGFVISMALKPMRLFVNRVTIFFGKISFSLYLVHFAVIYVTAQYKGAALVPNQILNYSVRYVLVLAVGGTIALALHTFVELPGQQTGKRLIRFLHGLQMPIWFRRRLPASLPRQVPEAPAP